MLLCNLALTYGSRGRHVKNTVIAVFIAQNLKTSFIQEKFSEICTLNIKYEFQETNSGTNI